MSYPKLKPVSTKYGAPMGRHENASDPGDEKVYVCRVHLDSGGYDPGGAYWGHGQPLFHVTTAKGDFTIFTRAHSRSHCIDALIEDYPHIRFYRGASK